MMRFRSGMFPSALVSGAAALLAMVAPVEPLSAARDNSQLQASTRDLYLMLIRQARDDGHSRAALAFLDDFERQFPNVFEAQILRINCLLDLGQIDEAELAATALTERDRTGTIKTMRGHVLSAQQRWDEAIAEYREALRQLPSDALLNNALGYAQLRSGLSGDAIETLRRARELSPQDPVIRNNLLLALTLSGRNVEVDAEFTRIGGGPAVAALREQVRAEAHKLALAETGPAKGREP